MTDAAAAPGLTDVWNLVLAVAARQPIQLRVLAVLGVLVALILIIDGIRANFRRTQPQALHIARMPYERPRPAAAPVPGARRTLSFKAKRPVRKLSPHKAPRPSINRTLPIATAFSAAEPEAPREEPPQSL